MRSLGTIRARVERLVGPTTPETMLISWQGRNQRCPACAADLTAHAAETALAAAVAGQRPGDPPPTMVWFSTDELRTCPRCGARLP
jgi:hypothetical protein